MAILQQTATTLPQIRPSPYANNTQQILSNTRKDENGLFSNIGLSAKSEVETRPMLRRLTAAMFPRIASQIGYGNELQDDKEGAISGLLALLSRGTQQANAQALARQARGVSMDNAQAAAMIARSQGLGSAGAESAIHDSFNQGNSAANANLSNYYSPEGQAQLLQMVLQAINAGQDTSGLKDLMEVNQVLQSKPQEQSGGGIGGLLGNLAGSWAGGVGGAKFFSNVFK